MKPTLQEINTKYDVDTKYDELNVVELKKRLNREPTVAEIVNSDKDSDQVTEIMWQLTKDLAKKVGDLEAKLVANGVV